MCVRGKTQLQDHPLTNDELLDLSRNSQRELFDEADVARDLVVCDTPSTESEDVLFGTALTGSEADPRAELFAHFSIGHTYHLHVRHFGVSVEKLLNLSWIDVLSAPDHHVFDP